MSVTPRTRNPKGRGDRLRVELLDAAADLIAELGSVDRVALRAVAGRAGVSPTAVYRHFDDHDDLMSAAVTHCWQQFAAALAHDPAEADDPHARFAAMGAAYLDFAAREPGKYAVLFSLTAPVAAPSGACTGQVFDGLVSAVDAILTLHDDDRDPRFVAHQVLTWTHGIATLSASPHKTTDAPSARELIESLIVELRLDDRSGHHQGATAADTAPTTV